ncbi:Clr5 domain-containing protein [Xylaria curta]|nr:Clr5 domain-containing protein [Xylaria curta]
MASNQISTSWAHAEDWDKQRRVITELYIYQKTKLKDVMRIMKEKYGFCATIKMYKTHFKKWGLMKNKRSKPTSLQEINPKHPNRSTKATDASVETNQKSKPKQFTIAKKNERLAENRNSMITPGNSWPRSVIRCMAAPDFYKFPEDSLRFTQVYFTTIRFPDPKPSLSGNTFIAWPPAAAEWVNFAFAARTLVTLGYPRRALLLVDMCCRQYRSLLSLGDLSIVDITTAAIPAFFALGAGLVEAFIDFACNMCQIILGTFDPLSILYQKLKAAGAENIVPCSRQALQYYWPNTVRVDSRPLMESFGCYYKLMTHGDVFDERLVLRHLQSLQHRLQYFFEQQAQGSPESQHYLLEHVHAFQCRIAWIHFCTGQHEEATQLVLEVLSEPLADARVISGGGCYDILYEVAVAKNDHDLALGILQKGVEVSAQGYGYAHCVTTCKMAALESYLRIRGRLDEADKVCKDVDRQLEQICGGVQRLKLSPTSRTKKAPWASKSGNLYSLHKASYYY